MSQQELDQEKRAEGNSTAPDEMEIPKELFKEWFSRKHVFSRIVLAAA